MLISFWVHKGKDRVRLQAQPGMCAGPLLREAGLLALPCGGAGRCGKCRIQVVPPPPPGPEERALLDEKALADGWRLACHTRVEPDMIITVPCEERLRVRMDFAHTAYVCRPLVRQGPLCLPAPRLDDQRSDLQRVMDACGAQTESLTLAQLAGLPDFVRAPGPKAARLIGTELVGYGPAETSHALVIDLGTTTIAALLVDLQQRRVVRTRGEGNAQAPFGADVISRIHRQTEERAATRGNRDSLREAVVRQLNDMLAALLREAGVDRADCLAIAGNTAMLHLLCGIPGQYIARAPFIPAALGARRLPAQALGLRFDAPVFLLPGISAYIGADIVASLLAADAHHAQPPFLLVDIGTNAEIVLGVNGTLYACSAAAGPCFEGATLSCGMAGQHGAIAAVRRDAFGDIEFTTLGHVSPRGLCGSGVLDAVAVLLEAGLLDETGRLQADDTPLGRRIVSEALEFAPGVRLTQRDIREVQLAKAAVRAGIELLLQEAGLHVDDVACLYIAGGFGSALAPRSAARVGLIPTALAGRVKVLGNAACLGALRYITEECAVEGAASLARRTRHIELSALPAFSDAYLEQIPFSES